MSRALLLLAAVGVGLGACTASRPTAAVAILAIDDAGDTVRLPRPAARVVSLVPATTELLFAIGAGDRLVGRTTWCRDPAAALGVPAVGDGLAPNVEAIVARAPDVVILYRSARNAEARDRLRALGIPAVQVVTDALDDVPRVAALLGTLTGTGAGADAAMARLADGLRAAGADAAEGRPRVLVLQWDQPPMVAGQGSHLSDFVARAGGVNVFADLPAASAPVSLEAIVARDPDAILVTGADEPRWLARPEWQALRAARERRLVRVEGSAFSWPGPRAPEAIRQLRAVLAALPAPEGAP